MSPEINIAIFASGSGTNAQNLIQYFRHHPRIKVRLVVSNKADAYVLHRAQKEQVPQAVIKSPQWKDSGQEEGVLTEHMIDFIILAGYLLLIPQWLIARYPDRIINIHPALLPRFGGKGMFGEHVHKAVIAAGEKESGISIHYVNTQYDEGNIIFQARCPVLESDDPKSLAQRIHQLEYEHYPKVAEQVILSKFQ